jgi:hypothetical protein
LPEICRFFGIIVRLHYRDHHPPHFHATHQGRKVEISIETLAVLDGSISSRALGLVVEWASLHQGELSLAWQAAASGRPPGRIPPLS